ncbi:hypothetical protein [Uliginosibacterium sp. 31-12]|uniref:hypothetical protein n=1 Tax=Uliginosibacterium sp. 31-12 TaxID=3062781 RepID=UPI0026E47A8F|nr:hypothetical protein [Uliginosibacterium sp. 31-12]MDO6386018.1 hypothetical protein [Uliginosibacterium sp. 31-12]
MKRILAALLALGCLAPATAAPAAWYWWVSRATGQRVCSQTSPGEGWLHEKRAYDNSRCEA